jgi:hypothetical protein
MSTTQAWDDPVIVATLAAQFLGKTTNDHYMALSEARSLLVMASGFIRREIEWENEDAAVNASILNTPISERKFIDQMVADHCHDRRFDRRQAFFERRWLALCRQYPQKNAPGLAERSRLYTEGTLQCYWQLFRNVCTYEAHKARSRKKLEKSSTAEL